MLNLNVPLSDSAEDIQASIDSTTLVSPELISNLPKDVEITSVKIHFDTNCCLNIKTKISDFINEDVMKVLMENKDPQDNVLDLNKIKNIDNITFCLVDSSISTPEEKTSFSNNR